MKILFQLIIIFLPWFLRYRLLNIILGYSIHKKARIGFSIILAKNLIMEQNSKIGNLTLCNRIDLLFCKEYSQIGSLNYITGFAVNEINAFSHVKERRCELIIGIHTHITSRHYFDCNGGIYIGDYTTIAGLRTQILTHSIDPYINRQDASQIFIGDYCFIGTNCTILKGSTLPNYTILGASSLLNKVFKESECLIAGVPAKLIKKIGTNDVKYFQRKNGFVL